MTLESQVLSIGFGPGLDTKTDPKAASKPVLLKDCIFTNPHRITKRNGYDLMTSAIVGGGTISSPTMAKNFGNELVLAATATGASVSGQRLFGYSPSLLGWVDRGKYNSISVSKQTIAAQDAVGVSATGGAIASSCAVSGSLALFSYGILQPTSGAYISVLDLSSSSQITQKPVIIPSSINASSRAVLLGASTLAVIYENSSSSALCIRVVTVNLGGGVSFGSEVVIAAAFNSFDFENSSSGGVISYADGSGHLVTVTIDTAGSITHTSSLTTSGLLGPISVNIGSNGNVWVYWADGTTQSNIPIYYLVLSSTLSSVLGKTTIATGLRNVIQMTAYENSPTQQTLFYSTYVVAQGQVVVDYPTINQVSLTSAGSVGSLSVFLNNVEIYSTVTSFNSTKYLAVMSLSQLTPTGFIVDIADGMAVAKFLPDQAEGLYGQGDGTAGVRARGSINDLVHISSSKLYLCAGVVTSLFTQANTTATGKSEIPLSYTMGVSAITFDFSNIDSYQSVIQQDTLVLNGGIVSQYDGSQVVELGFSVDPELICVTSSSGGSIPAGQWVYYAVYEWTDSNGNLNQSAPSIGFVVNFGSGSTNSVRIDIQTLTMTQKVGASVAVSIYRTISGGTIPQKLTSIFNVPTSNEVTFLDTYAVTDDLIKLNPVLYTEGGAILENLAPPPSMILWTNNNRIWCIDSENPETTIEYSKTASQGTGISFSSGQLEILVDSKNGVINGASPMDEKTIILKKNGIGFFIGDGANDSGTGSTLSRLQFVPSDVGGTNSKSVISYPEGIIFKSPKGIYRINRGVQVSYFGFDVEAYNAQDIQSALIVSSKNQIRFLTSGGSSLLYDYAMNQWSVFTNHTGYSSDSYADLYVYVRTDGSVYLENTTSFLDNSSSFSPYIQMFWMKGQSIQNYERIRRIILLGDYQNGSSSGHGVQISASYDFGTSVSSPISYFFGAPSSSGSFQYRERLPKQKCDSIQLIIQEITTGASGEFIDFTDLGMEMAVKKGLNKLAGSRSV